MRWAEVSHGHEGFEGSHDLVSAGLHMLCGHAGHPTWTASANSCHEVWFGSVIKACRISHQQCDEAHRLPSSMLPVLVADRRGPRLLRQGRQVGRRQAGDLARLRQQQLVGRRGVLQVVAVVGAQHLLLRLQVVQALARPLLRDRRRLSQRCLPPDTNTIIM